MTKTLGSQKINSTQEGSKNLNSNAIFERERREQARTSLRNKFCVDKMSHKTNFFFDK